MPKTASSLQPSLTCLCFCRHWAMAFPIPEAKEQELVLAGWVQARYCDLMEVSAHRHHLGLSLRILVLDQEGVEETLGHCP